MTWQPPEEIHLRRRISRGAIFFVLAGSLLAGFATVERDCIFFAVPLYLLAILAWVMEPKTFTMRFHADGIEHRESGIRIPYGAITFLGLKKRVLFDATAGAKETEMLIGHPGGCLRLPGRAAVPRLELYRFLRDQSRLLDPPAHFPGRLREVYEREVADFGAAQVLASGGRGAGPCDFQGTRLFFVLAFIFFGSAIVAAAGSANEGIAVAFGVITGFLFFMGVLLSAVLRGQRRTLGKVRAASGIVISPRGLTLETPTLKGALGWAELKGIVVMNRANAILSGLLLKIEGGQILVGDHFTCPLTEIRRRIEANLAHE